MNKRSVNLRCGGRLRSAALAGGLWLASAGGLGTAGLVGLAGCRLHATGPALAEAARPASFTLPSTSGTLDSAAALAQGPLVLIFYRGHW